MLSVTACRPDAAMLIMVFFTLLSFLEESPSHPYPAGNYALIKKIKKILQCLSQASELHKTQNGGFTVVNDD